jgi:hypothetical protein
VNLIPEEERNMMIRSARSLFAGFQQQEERMRSSFQNIRPKEERGSRTASVRVPLLHVSRSKRNKFVPLSKMFDLKRNAAAGLQACAFLICRFPTVGGTNVFLFSKYST